MSAATSAPELASDASAPKTVDFVTFFVPDAQAVAADLEKGEYRQSQYFWVLGYRCALRFYPHGTNKAKAGQMSVLLMVDPGDGERARLDFVFGFAEGDYHPYDPITHLFAGLDVRGHWNFAPTSELSRFTNSEGDLELTCGIRLSTSENPVYAD